MSHQETLQHRRELCRHHRDQETPEGQERQCRHHKMPCWTPDQWIISTHTTENSPTELQVICKMTVSWFSCCFTNAQMFYLLGEISKHICWWNWFMQTMSYDSHSLACHSVTPHHTLYGLASLFVEHQQYHLDTGVTRVGEEVKTGAYRYVTNTI